MDDCRNQLLNKYSGGKLFLALLIVLFQPATSPAQTVRWLRQFGTAGGDQARAVATDRTSVYVAGTTSGTFAGQTSAGQDDAFVRKVDSAGNVLWTSQFGTISNDTGDAVAVDGTSVYVAGSTSGTFAGQTSFGGPDGYVRKYDSNGNVIWTRQFGGNDIDVVAGMAVDSSGVYVAGSISLQGGVIQASLRKFDLNGNPIWTRNFGAGISSSLQAASSDGSGVYVVGRAASIIPSQADSGAFVRRYDRDGNDLWTQQFGGANNAIATGVFADTNVVYIVGTVGGALPGQTTTGGTDIFLRKYDTGGNEQWTRQFGTQEMDDALAVTADPTGAYITGQTYGEMNGGVSAGGIDAFLRKYDVIGNQRWTRHIGSAGTDIGKSLAVDPNGLYFAGIAGGVIAGQSGAGGVEDAVLAQLDLGGPPFLSFNSVLNAATYQPSVVGGSIASAFGLGLLAQNPSSLLVQVGGITATVFANTPSQINFQVPWEVASQSPVFLVVTVDGNTSSPVAVPIAGVAPGLFSTNASGSGQGAVLINNTTSVAAPAGMFPGSRPVNRGEYISIYATGLGPVTNQPPTGMQASGNSQTIATPIVTFGGAAGNVIFSGLAPGFVGLYQINVQIPPGAPSGNSVPLVVSISGTSSNTVTIAVQ